MGRGCKENGKCIGLQKAGGEGKRGLKIKPSPSAGKNEDAFVVGVFVSFVGRETAQKSGGKGGKGVLCIPSDGGVFF